MRDETLAFRTVNFLWKTEPENVDFYKEMSLLS